MGSIGWTRCSIQLDGNFKAFGNAQVPYPISDLLVEVASTDEALGEEEQDADTAPGKSVGCCRAESGDYCCTSKEV